MDSPALLYFLFDVAALWPLARVCRRAGLPAWWAGFVMVPVFGLAIVLGRLALTPWPARPIAVKTRTPKARRTVA
jgi:hypothetical protein